MRPPVAVQLGVAICRWDPGGYHVELSLDGLLVAAGLYHQTPPSSGASAERIRAELDSARPLVAWLRKHVGPSAPEGGGLSSGRA
jgi:hypothetical protein